MKFYQFNNFKIKMQMEKVSFAAWGKKEAVLALWENAKVYYR